MADRAQQIEDELKNIPITKDAYELWLENDVTRVFMLQVEAMYLDVALSTSPGGTIEQIAIFELKRGSEADTLKSVLDWNPLAE